MPIDSVVQLVRLIQQYRLLDAPQLEELARTVAPRFTVPRSLAKELLQRDWLTAYQINQLFQGRGGDLLFNHFVLLERLGEGGMGQVFKARNRKLGQIVALKIIHRDRQVGPESIRRFLREIETVSKLVHPNIVQAIDADEIGGAHFFVMEYVEGTDLAKLVKQTGPLPPALASDYIRQAALGLQHAHQMGLVHRDIKPANLLLTKKGVVKLVDLGLARRQNVEEAAASTALTQVGSILGTPDYIAPEQARNSSNADIRSDLYSLGCTLYFLLTGEPPFPGGALTEKLLRHQLDPPPSVRLLRPEVPAILDDVIQHLMAKQPEDRIQTPGELAALLAGKMPVPARLTAGPRPALAGRPFPSPQAPATQTVPVALPVAAESRTVAVAASVGSAHTDFDTPIPLSVTRIEVHGRRPARRWPWWLLGGLAVFVMAGTMLMVVGAKMAFSRSKPRGDTSASTKVTSIPEKEKEKDKPKPPADAWKATVALRKLKGRVAPDDYKPNYQPTSVDLSGTLASDADLINLAAMPNVTALNLAGTKITDKGLAQVESLTKLTSLTLTNTAVTDEGLSHLKSLTELWELNLHGTQVRGTGLVHLLGAKKLKVLNLTHSKVDDSGLAPLAGLPQLEQLILQLHPSFPNKITNAGMAYLKGLTKLTHLTLQDTSITDEGLGQLKNVGVQLTHLNLTNTKVSDVGLAKFKSLSKLQELYAGGTNVGDKGLEPLRGATKLQIVVLNGTQVRDASVIIFKDKVELHTLNLANTRVSNEGLKPFADRPKLNAVAKPVVLPAVVWSLRSFAAWSKLRSLDLGQTAVTDAGLIHLKGLDELAVLSLSSTQVRGPGLAQLKRLRKLTNLTLDATPIDDAGLKGVGDLTPLTSLSLLGCRNFTDEGVVSLRKLRGLKTLILQNTSIGDQALVELEALKTLETLNLAQTMPRVTEEGVAKLKKALPKLIVTAYN
jgi:serine/threonine protein kinase